MQKVINVEDLDTPIVIARRKGTRNIKLSVKSDGSLRVSVSFGVPEVVALNFVKQKADWIRMHVKPQQILKNGDRIGKSHVLQIVTNLQSNTIRTRLRGNTAVITMPPNTLHKSPEVQRAVRKVAERALALEAENLLPQRLEMIAAKHKINYRSASTRKLKSRWGSCDNRHNIVLNTYLMQVDWSLIDYVIVHELAHISHPHHQPAFWQEVERMMPDWKNRRKQLKAMRTSVLPTIL